MQGFPNSSKEGGEGEWEILLVGGGGICLLGADDDLNLFQS